MAERIKNVNHPKSPTQRRLQRQGTAQVRKERWDNMSTAERYQQKVDQGYEDTVEAGALLIKLEKEMDK